MVIQLSAGPGSNGVLCFHTAQHALAILLASATVALLCPTRFSSFIAQRWSRFMGFPERARVFALASTDRAP